MASTFPTESQTTFNTDLKETAAASQQETSESKGPLSYSDTQALLDAANNDLNLNDGAVDDHSLGGSV